MAIFTLYYERNRVDECGSEIQKRKLVLEQLMQKIENEIRFEMFKTPDGKRYKANVTVMNDAVCNRVMNVLHQLQKLVDFPEKRMISEVMSLIVGIPSEQSAGISSFLQADPESIEPLNDNPLSGMLSGRKENN